MPKKDTTVKSASTLAADVTTAYLQTLNQGQLPPLEKIRDEILSKTRDAISLENSVQSKGTAKWRVPDALSFMQIAEIISVIYPVRCVYYDENVPKDYDLLAIYMPDGPEMGTYQTSRDTFLNIIYKLNPNIVKRDVDEVCSRLKLVSPRVHPSRDPDLIAVNNGVFNYKTKTLMPFTPNLVFMSKSHTNYIKNVSNPVLRNTTDNTDWDVESWMQTLSDDPEIVNLLWEILGAIVRPNVPWNKSAWLYSEQGNNGKGTLCVLMRNLLGKSACASIPLSDFGKDFALEPLVGASAIVVDENDVGTFIDKAANLKAVITGDVISINRKYKTPIAYKFTGFMVQCLNEYPLIKDRSNSLYRRQLFIPMTKSFTGHVREYIKQEYLYRQDVLEYVLNKVLNTDFYHLSEPLSCQMVLSDYKEYNDPVRQFANEILPQCKWDLLPFTFLWDLYCSWFKRNNPSGTSIGRNKFISNLLSIISEDDEWFCPDKHIPIRSQGRMDCAEPLIQDYDLTAWQAPVGTYSGSNANKLCRPAVASMYRGILRTGINLSDIGAPLMPEDLNNTIIPDPNNEGENDAP